VAAENGLQLKLKDQYKTIIEAEKLLFGRRLSATDLG